MISIKSKVFNYLSSSQKSQICSYLAKFAKKHFKKDEHEILDLFIEEEKYYLTIHQSRHEWIDQYIDDEQFFKDIKLYINYQIKKLKVKERQQPYIEKQKELQKQQRKSVQDFKMSKEPATKAQISYYKTLCKKYKEDMFTLNLDNSSKLDLKNAINDILRRHSENKSVKLKIEEILSTKMQFRDSFL